MNVGAFDINFFTKKNKFTSDFNSVINPVKIKEAFSVDNYMYDYQSMENGIGIQFDKFNY